MIDVRQGSVISAVISDVRPADGLAKQRFIELSEVQRSLPWFFLTGYGSRNDAVSTVRTGAREYLTNPSTLSVSGLLGSLISAPGASAMADPGAPFASLKLMVEEVERLHIRRGLALTAGSVSKTAKLLGVSRRTLGKKMKRLQIGRVPLP